MVFQIFSFKFHSQSVSQSHSTMNEENLTRTFYNGQSINLVASHKRRNSKATILRKCWLKFNDNIRCLQASNSEEKVSRKILKKKNKRSKFTILTKKKIKPVFKFKPSKIYKILKNRNSVWNSQDWAIKPKQTQPQNCPLQLIPQHSGMLISPAKPLSHNPKPSALISVSKSHSILKSFKM